MRSIVQDLKKIIEPTLEKLYRYIEQSQQGQGKVLQQKRPEIISAELQLEHWIRKGSLDEHNIGGLIEKYLEHSQHMHHPQYIGHQVAVPHLASGIAALIHGLINNPMGIYEMGPAAATMEKVSINWMLDKLGWFHGLSLHDTDDELIRGGGILTHGGSMANLTAMLAARARIEPEAWTKGNSGKLVVLVPEVSHYSIARSISIMGMGSACIIPIKVDKLERIIPAELLAVIERVRGSGRQIMAVVANACATSTGLYDPLDEIGRICRERQLWFHVDGAHGAGAALLEKEKHLLKGIENADSLIWDAHKMLRTSALSAAVLFKNYVDLDNTFRQKGSYIYFEKEQIGFDLMTKSLECTKAGLGAKIFWVLAAEGEAGIARYIQRQYEITKVFHKIIQQHPHFECPYYPESNILCFKYINHTHNHEFQLKIRNELIKRGDYYITTSTICGERFLRLTVMSPDTTEKHIEGLLGAIEQVASEIE